MGEPGATAVVADIATPAAAARKDAETAAWIVILPLALLAVPLIALLARPVGALADPHVRVTDFLPWAQRYFRPEPREQGMYLLSLAVPVAFAAAILVAAGRFAATSRAAVALALLAKVGLAGLVVASMVAQYGLHYEWIEGAPRFRFFSPATLTVAAAIATGIVAAIRSSGLRPRLERAMRDSRHRRIGVLGVAASITGIWMLHAVQTDSSIVWARGGIMTHMAYTSDETFAVINGLTPFVDARPLYSTLWPYVIALPLLAFGKTLLVFTFSASAITALALLAGFGILRRVTGNSASALLLYLPFLATSFFLREGNPANGFTPGNYLADFPLRYAGPLLLAWLTARELDRPRPRAPWVLFVAAGLVVLNNIGVGVPALGATIAAVAIGAPSMRLSRFELARGVATGLLLAVGAVTVLTLAHSGTLPHFDYLSEFSRYFLGGFGSTPLHSVLGVHLLLYLTYVAALATATVRVRNRAPGRVLTGMLVWNGVFGLGILSYFVAESGPLWLLASFSSWALTLMLLATVVVRRLAADAARWPDPAELAVLFGLGVMVCSLAQFPTPWSQIERLTGDHRGVRPSAVELHPYVPDPRARTFIASITDGRGFYLKRGAPVALLFENGHRVADAYGVVNVSPYVNAFEMFTRASVRRAVAALRRAGGNTVVTGAGKEPAPDVNDTLSLLGFGIVTADGIVRATNRAATTELRGETLIKWVDLRNLHPRALQHGRGRLVGRIRLLTR
jgi:hypothetical protein